MTSNHEPDLRLRRLRGYELEEKVPWKAILADMGATDVLESTDENRPPEPREAHCQCCGSYAGHGSDPEYCSACGPLES